MGSGVAMATAFSRACLAEIWISCLFLTLNWIVMLGIEYFGNLEHCCYKKNAISDFFSWSVTSPMTSYKFRGKFVKSGEWRHNSFIIDFSNFFCCDFLFIWYILDPFLLKQLRKFTQSWLQLTFNECHLPHFSFPSSHISKSYVSLTYILFGWPKIQAYCLTYW